MKIQLNFEPYSLPGESATVAEILARKRWSFPLIIVKIDGEVVARDDWATRSVRDGNTVEMYHLVSGG